MLNAMYAIVGFLCTFIADTSQNHFLKSSLVSLKMESNLSPLKGPLVAIVGSPSGLVENYIIMTCQYYVGFNRFAPIMKIYKSGPELVQKLF